MQLKTALLSTAVVAALAGLGVYATRTDTGAVASAAGASAVAPTGPDRAAAPHDPHDPRALAAAARNRAALRAMIDTSARPGSLLAWSSTSPAEADRSAAAERTRGLLASVGAREAHVAKADGFAARDVMIDRDGTEHVRVDRSYQGLPVVGGDIVVHSRNGELLSITQGSNMLTDARPQLKPAISAAQARSDAGAQFDGRVAELDPARLVVYARNGMEPTLAYQVDLRGERADNDGPGVMSYFMDARTGGLLEAEDRVQTAAAQGTGKTLTLGDVGIVTNSVSGGYELTDPSRGNGQTLDLKNSTSTFSAKKLTDADNIWGNNTASDRATAAADAYYGVAATWDYYKTVHGRNGISNDGKGVKSYVHYGKGVFNAFWDGSAMSMSYGDGNPADNDSVPLVGLDVAGHEMTHGVTGATAKLGYYNIKDSGGINEAVSDIFGTLVEFSAGSAADPGDFLIGENLNYHPGGAGTQVYPLRVMFQQNLDVAFRSAKPSFKCYPAGGFSGAETKQKGKFDPHFTSGVGSLAFYLMSQGSVVGAGYPNLTAADLACNGDSAIQGFGMAKAGKIWYDALTKYMVSSTDYPGARAATLSAAKDAYGADSDEYKTVARAWSAVNVN